MGEILRINSLKVKINSNDHEPAHVHIRLNNSEAKMEIETMEIYWARGFSQKELNRIEKALIDYKDYFQEKWNEIQKD